MIWSRTFNLLNEVTIILFCDITKHSVFDAINKHIHVPENVWLVDIFCTDERHSGCSINDCTFNEISYTGDSSILYNVFCPTMSVICP